MKIVIVGLTVTGNHLASLLAEEHHDVTVISKEEKMCKSITDRYSVNAVCGNASSKEILTRAGVPTSDVIVCLTESDETNLHIALMAKKMGCSYAAVMLMDPAVYAEREELAKIYQVDFFANPRNAIAEAMVRQLGLPAKVRADGYFEQAATIIRFVIGEDSPLCKLTVQKAKEFLNEKILVAAVCRKEHVTVPHGEFVLEAGDEISILTGNDIIREVAVKLKCLQKPVKKVFLVGCGSVGSYLVEKLLEEKIGVTIVDVDHEKCIKLRETMPPSVEVNYVERLDAEELKALQIHRHDAVVLLTGADDVNLVITMFAWSLSVSSILTKIDMPTYETIFNKANLALAFSPASLCGNNFVTFIRNVEVYNDQGNDINQIYPIAGGAAETIEFIAYDTSKGLHTPLKDLAKQFKKDVLIGAIIRDKKLMIPDGQTTIEPGDRVIVVTKERLRTLNEIYK
ncbi:MAG: Trk system potassium transporter TrkA [Lachnospiraceae bacterium]|nr:Trk system potassium transporter TrkA [Lachnospiraceae bacterium]